LLFIEPNIGLSVNLSMVLGKDSSGFAVKKSCKENMKIFRQRIDGTFLSRSVNNPEAESRGLFTKDIGEIATRLTNVEHQVEIMQLN
jgi:hypothetical protein